MREFARAFYASKAWKTTRLAKIRSVYGICERCGEPGRIVHHKVFLTPANINDPAISLALGNLELLCMDCHNEEHLSKKPIAKGLTFNEDGDLCQR